jgi:asparagine synthase (glutamine-hydrolysing)
LSIRAAFGHRRLVVIDPQGGIQPMMYETTGRKYIITYNGEIYNYRELRHELQERGHTFASQSDTEVLLHTYVEWGEDCVRHLNGIFAFGIWDEQKQQLLLARDHLGVKPLFYAQRGSATLFGSELKALLANPLVKAEIDEVGMAEIFNFSPGRTPGCGVFRNIDELRPGHMALFTHERTRVVQYWSLHSAPHTDDLETTTEHIRALLEDTVQRQLIADMPVVAMLSGGLDSSGLVGLAGRDFKREGKTLDTYSIDFVDSTKYFHENALRPSLDTPWIQRVSDYVGTRQHTITVDTPELVENLLVPMHAFDLPLMGEIATSLYLLFKAMKRDATVALSGESADEVFGGYPWFHRQEAITGATFPWLAMTEAGIAMHTHLPWLSVETQEKMQLEAYMARRYQEALAEVPRLEGESPLEARRREIFYLNLTRFLLALLDRKDRMSMAVGFEVRVPYCDYRLVEYVWNIPWEMKTVDQIEKGILRRALTGVLPDDARTRRKSAYPSTQNPSYLKALQDWTLHILHDSNSPILPFIDTTVVGSLAKGTMPLPTGPQGIALFEHIIQINAWFRDYHVTVC